jgi:hypothetical protein
MVALSTLEAEFIACSNATREVICLRSLIASLRPHEPQTPIPVFTDNQEALKLIETGVLQSQTKHIDVKCQHSHDEQEKGVLKFHYVPTDDNVADIMTKPLPLDRYEALTCMLGLFAAQKEKDLEKRRLGTGRKRKGYVRRET